MYALILEINHGSNSWDPVFNRRGHGPIISMKPSLQGVSWHIRGPGPETLSGLVSREISGKMITSSLRPQ